VRSCVREPRNNITIRWPSNMSRCCKPPGGRPKRDNGPVCGPSKPTYWRKTNLGWRGAGQALAGTFADRTVRPNPSEYGHAVLALSGRATARRQPCWRPPEAAAISQLPCQEFPGYVLRERVAFSVSPPAVAGERRVAIGNIMDGGHRSGNWFELGVDDFAKHVFVAGVPGSGKTHTCQYLLSQLWSEHRIPWLVVEPSSKSEYRRLTASALGGDLQVYTLGDETCAPLRLNPFEVLPGMPVQTHIEALSSLFAASFALVTPMPDVLNQALHQVYMDLGWDLLRGTNPKATWRKCNRRYPI